MALTVTIDELRNPDFLTGCRLIDVRELSERTLLQPKDAVAIPLSRLANELPKIPLDRPVVLICWTGRGATQAVQSLQAGGYSDFWALEGGFAAWLDAGLPVVEGRMPIIGLERERLLAAAALAVLGTALGCTLDAHWHALSAIAGADLLASAIRGANAGVFNGRWMKD